MTMQNTPKLKREGMGISVGEEVSYNVDNEGNGIIRDYDKDNQGKLIPRQVRNLTNGQLDGLYELNDEQGRLIKTGFYCDGLKNGEWGRFFWNNNNQELELLETYKMGVLNGYYEQRDPISQVVIKGFYVDGKKDGQWERWSFNKNSFLLKTYKNGQLNGPYKKYSAGFLIEEGNYTNGQRDGIWRKDNRNRQGELIDICEETYKNGQLDGPYRVYDEQGRLTDEGNYEDGRREGEWKEYEYDKDGNRYLRRITTYENDEKNGPCYIYDEKGNLIEKKFYKNGKEEVSEDISLNKTLNEKATVVKGDNSEKIISKYRSDLKENNTVLS